MDRQAQDASQIEPAFNSIDNIGDCHAFNSVRTELSVFLLKKSFKLQITTQGNLVDEQKNKIDCQLGLAILKSAVGSQIFCLEYETFLVSVSDYSI